MDRKIFKANDIRGKYPGEIKEEIVSKISETMGGYFRLKNKKSGRQVKIAVCHDARLSSPSLYKVITNGLKHSNVLKNIRIEIIGAGIATTPMFYFLVNKLKADGGIMATASHNPKEYNGLKIVGKKAMPISGKEIEKLLIL